MRHENTKKLFGYWNRVRGSRVAPERSEIEPSDIREVLADTFILEVSARLRTISFRLAGTRLCAAYGKELKSYGYLGMWSEEDSYEIAKSVAKVYGDRKPVLINSVAHTASGHFVEYETLLLPLLTTGEDNSRILGISTPKTLPYWLGAEALETNTCRGLRVMEIPQNAAMHVPELVPELGDISDAGGKSRPKRVAHLTIFDGGRS
ncbi:MAG: PAS domain-containing protein [Nitratireductor sp.]